MRKFLQAVQYGSKNTEYIVHNFPREKSTYLSVPIYFQFPYRYICTRSIPISKLQVASAKLVNNMSSGVSVPSLGHLFPKLE